MRLVPRKSGYLSLLLLGVLTPGVVVLGRLYFSVDGYFENVRLLQSLQTFSAFFAFSAGIVLFISGVCAHETGEPEPERIYLPWLSCALLSMGVLTGLSSAFPEIRSPYLLMELVSQVMGAFFCACVWLPYVWTQSRSMRWLMPVLSFFIATAIGMKVLLSDGNFPRLLVDNYYGPVYVYVSRLTGSLFVVAVLRFVWQFHRYRRLSDLVFAQLALLSAASDFVFERLHLWGPIWWSWHFIQFVALGLTFLYLFTLYYRQEKTLKESESRFAMLSNVVFEGVLVTENGIVVDNNQAFEALYQCGKGEVVGARVETLFSGIPSWASSSKPVEAILVGKKGTPVDVEIRSRAGDRQENRIYTVHDISLQKAHELQLKHLAGELERSNRDLEHFAQLASHDLREPLRMVNSFLGLLQKKHLASLNDEAKEYVRYASDGATRMHRLVEALLSYAKACHEPVTRGVVQSQNIVTEAVSDLRLAIEESHSQVRCENLPEIWADGTQLRRVFENLIHNAIKYRGSRPPEILVRAIDQDDQWKFEIVDNGRGIPEPFQEKIFDLFARGPTRDAEGVGIGLAACKAVIERHGGRIGVETRAGEGGSIFFFTLPKDRAARHA